MNRIGPLHCPRTLVLLRGVPVPFTLFVLIWMATCPPLSATPAGKDEFVPEGAFAFELDVFREEQSLAFDRSGNLNQLIKIVIPDRSVRDEVKGDISRGVTDYHLGLTIGIRDSWNVVLQAPYRVLKQDSTLTTSSTEQEEQDEVNALSSQTLSGMGDLRVMTMFRPVFSDRNGFVWGYGLTHPITGQTESRPGLFTLALRSPNPIARGFVHYTRYPRLERARFDVRAELQTGLPGSVEFDDGRTDVYRSGNGVQIEVGWFQEIGPVGAGISLEEFRQGPSRLGGVSLSDPREETLVHARIGSGNLRALEEGPLALPFQVMLEFDRSLRGFNVPYSDGYTLSILFFF